MRVVVDVSPLSRPRTGIGNYLRGLVAGLAEAGAEVVAFGPSGPRGRRLIRESLAGLPVELRLPLLPRAQVWRAAWSRIGRPPVEVVVGPLDVFHFSDWMYPSQRGGVRTTTVHDLVPLRFPEWVEPATLRMHGSSTRTLRAPATASSSTRVLPARRSWSCSACPRSGSWSPTPGSTRAFGRTASGPTWAGPTCSGSRRWSRARTCRRWWPRSQALRQRRPELTLALAGLEGWEERPLAAEGVRLLGFVSDDELARLYRGASAFAYPSRFEGFGIPVVEALASGTPAVVSSHPSLDEASGDAALRADPDDPEAFADCARSSARRTCAARASSTPLASPGARAAKRCWRATRAL